MFKNLVLCLCFFLTCFTQLSHAREIVDMRGKKILVPDNITRIATLSDGYIENILTFLGKIDTVDVIGSWGLKRDYSYTFPTMDGKEYTKAGLNTMRFLHPHLDELICVNSPQGNVINYEALTQAKPDLVLMRVGDCTVRADNMEATRRTIETIESLGFPLVVLYSPQFDKEYNTSSMKKEAEVIASIFGDKEVEKVKAFMAEAFSVEDMIRQRVQNIEEKDKKTVLYFGLNPNVRAEGGAGNVHGVNTPQSYMIEDIVNAKNAYKGLGSSVPVSAEQIYTFDADVLLLPTMNGYHPAEELYTAPYYALLKDVRAVKNKQVYPLGWNPMNCAPRLEYPLELLLMAKAIYPEKFEDIVYHDFALDFYKKAYHVDDATAKGLLKTQILDWTEENNW